MKLKRTHTIKVLLFIYLCISAAVCIALPSYLSDEENGSGTASISSAPLDLPQDIQQQIEKDLGSGDDTPKTTTEPETSTPPETKQEPETETPPETEPETEPEAPPENRAYISTKHAGAAVNLRAAANSGSKIIANVYDKDEVIVLSASGKWYEIQAGDLKGYIYQDYLVPVGE